MAKPSMPARKSATKAKPPRKRVAAAKPKPAAKRKPRAKPLASHLDAILHGIAGGTSLRAICRARGIDEGTVRYWLSKDAEAAAQFAAARELGCDALADECKEIADTPWVGEQVTRRPVVVEGKPTEVEIVETRTEDMLGHRKLQIDVRMRLIGQWSKRYGAKLDVNATHGLDPEVAKWLGMTS